MELQGISEQPRSEKLKTSTPPQVSFHSIADGTEEKRCDSVKLCGIFPINRIESIKPGSHFK
jgi:hypothetical protein